MSTNTQKWDPKNYKVNIVSQEFKANKSKKKMKTLPNNSHEEKDECSQNVIEMTNILKTLPG